jgi:predicted dehydrogenase
MTLDAQDAGKHVYIEKLLTWSIEQGKEIVAASDGRGTILLVGTSVPHAPRALCLLPSPSALLPAS